MPPARVIAMESTAAKIGRSMKKRENTRDSPTAGLPLAALQSRKRPWSLGRLQLADVDDEPPTALAVAADERLTLDQDGFAVELLHRGGQRFLLFRVELAEVQLPGNAGIGEDRAGRHCALGASLEL